MEIRKPGHEVLLGKYELGRLLGRGTFAKVYHATSLTDGGGVAIKVLDKLELVKTGMAPLILREVSAMRRLSHPNILRLHEVMATKSKIYLIMEHARGGELFTQIARRGRLTEPTARRYFQQLIYALRFCHAHGVSHRDVKPQNLLLDRDGNLKVSDFGLSALPDQIRDGLLHTACGTPAYTAPEVIRRKGYDGAKADAWSCGVILYVLLAGFLPFNDANLAAMYRRMNRREYRFPPWFSPSVKNVVGQLLDPNPGSRITIDGLLELPWFRRAYSLDQQLNLLDIPSSSRDGEEFDQLSTATSVSAPAVNAFDIISMSSGLDLSGLFDEGAIKRERRFTSMASVEKILERIEEIGGKFGYSVKRRKGGIVGWGRWGSMLSVEVAEVALPLLLVEMKVDGVGNGSKDGGEGLCWRDLRSELGDVVFAWQENGSEE